MVVECGYVVAGEPLCDVLCFFAAVCVDDGASGVFPECFEYFAGFVLCVADGVCEVGADEAHAVYARVVHLEVCGDVADDLWCGCGCECEQGCGGALLAELCYLEVCGAEVVSPL